MRRTLISFLLPLWGVFLTVTSASRNCPIISLESKKGVQLECFVALRGNRNCSTTPMPPGTVALYSCQPFYKEVRSSSQLKLMRCDKATGSWTRMEHFGAFKCEFECGRAQPSTKTVVMKGRLVSKRVWPWHALIYLRSNSSDSDPIHICGGTLISPSKVLTAAHCLTNDKGVPNPPHLYVIVVGGFSTHIHLNDGGEAQTFRVKSLHVPPFFNYSEFENDVGIIELEGEVKLSPIIGPVCLPDPNSQESRLFIAYGKSGEVVVSNPRGPRLLTSKRLKVLPTLDCARYIEGTPNEGEYCAGTASDEVVCSGDSGSGMVSFSSFGRNRHYIIQGIASYSLERKLHCENYAVFTRVYKYLDWIRGT